MTYNYKAYVPHGITFENSSGISKHTWKNWRIVPTSRPVFQPPAVKTIIVDIPGSDGILDMTESLTGEVHYNNRIGSLEFQVENKDRWNDVYSDIMDFIHGQQLKAVLDDDPDYYYTGRFSVNEWNSDPYRSKIVIDYNLYPFKMDMYGSLEDWLWDPFDFETGVVRDYKDQRVDGTLTFVIEGSRKSVVPTFIVESDDGNGLTVEFEGETYDLPDGSTRVVNIVIKEGTNTLVFTGYGTVSIDYRGGRL